MTEDEITTLFVWLDATTTIMRLASLKWERRSIDNIERMGRHYLYLIQTDGMTNRAWDSLASWVGTAGEILCEVQSDGFPSVQELIDAVPTLAEQCKAA